MAEDRKTLAIRCSSCGSRKIKCTNPREIMYNHLMEIGYLCDDCGHSGLFTVDCLERHELQVFVK